MRLFSRRPRERGYDWQKKFGRGEFFGQALPARFAEVREALATGEIGVDAADAIVKPLAQASVRCGDAEVRAAEERLVGLAAQGEGGCSLTPDQMRALAIRAREHLDADGAEPRYLELENERGLKFVKMRSGNTRIVGVLTPLQAGVWQAVSLSVGSPRVRGDLFGGAGEGAGDARGEGGKLDEGGAARCEVGSGGALDEGGAARCEVGSYGELGAGGEHGEKLGGGGEGGGDEVEVEVDARTVAQRRIDTLTEIMQRASGLPGMPKINGAKPVLSVRANLDDIVTGRAVGWIDGVEEPVPASVVQQLLCHSDIVTTLFGDNGNVLRLGKTRRLFSSAQNRALAERDGGCVWKGCDRPPEFCESHHVVEWKDRAYAPGVTDVDNGALLCAFHHRHLHTSEWELVMVGGVPHLIPPGWVDHERRPQRCRQQSDRLFTRTPVFVEPRVFVDSRSRRQTVRPRFTDAE